MMWHFNFGQNIAIIDENGAEITYAELKDACDKLVSQTNGRSLVFILCANKKGSVLGYTAFLNGGLVSLLLDADLERGLIDKLINIYKPDYLWIPQSLSERFADFSVTSSAWGYTLLKTPYNKIFPLHKELALLLTTSGSIGSPKLVRQSYINIRANTESIVEYLEIDCRERSITTMPMSYTYGLSIINSHLWVGASVILTEKTLMQKEFWRQLNEYAATSFGGVPYIYEMLNKLRFFNMDCPSLRIMTQAGGKLSPKLHREFAEHAAKNGKKFIVMYGQTEATARMSYLPAHKSLEKYGSVGIAIPRGVLTLIDSRGDEIGVSETVGELIYKGANVTLGYAENGADLAKGDERGGVLKTGDMAKRDTDGFYYIVGRKTRFLKIFGNRVNLDEIEQLLRSAFEGFDYACVGVDDKMKIYIANAKKTDEEYSSLSVLSKDIIKFLTDKTGFNHAAFETVIIESIPRGESGKISYGKL